MRRSSAASSGFDSRLLGLCCVVLAVWFQASRVGIDLASFRHSEDALQFAERWEAARVSIVDFHQFPSWNPYHCGGVALFGDAEAPLGPTFLLLGLVGTPTPVSMNLVMLLYLWAGALGAGLLVRDRGANLPEQLLAGAVVSGCGFIAHHFAWEHLSFAPFLLLPWILLAQRRSLSDVRWSVAVAALFALAVYEGGANPVPLMAVVVGLDSVARLADATQRARVVRSLAISVPLLLLLAAPRILAILRVLQGGRGATTENDGLDLGEVLYSLLRPAMPSDWAHLYGWDEYSAYIGLVPFVLMLVGAGFALARRDARESLVDLIMLMVLVWLALGMFTPIPLYAALHELPVYRNLRVPSRFLFPALVMLAVQAASGLAIIRTAATARLGRRVIAIEWLLIAFVVWDLAAAGRAATAEGPAAEPTRLSQAAASTSFLQLASVNQNPMPGNPVAGRGTTACYHPQYFARPAPGLRTGDVAQQWLVPADAGTVNRVRWSPNELVYELSLNRSATLIVNENADPGWSAGEGTTRETDGLLSVELQPGTRTVTLQHRPAGFVAGVTLLGLGVLIAAWLLRRPRVNRAFPFATSRSSASD